MDIAMQKSILHNAKKDWEELLQKQFENEFDDIYDMSSSEFLEWLERDKRRVPKMLLSKWQAKEEIENDIKLIKSSVSTFGAADVVATPAKENPSVATPVPNVMAGLDHVAATNVDKTDVDQADASDSETNKSYASASELSPAQNNNMEERTLFWDSDDNKEEDNGKPHAKVVSV
jgi:hypothetical protein